MKIFKAALLSVSLAFAPAAGAILPESYQAVSGKEALEAARQSGKPIMVYFNQRGCGWCMQVEKLLRETAMQEELKRSYHFINVDIGASKDPTSAALQKMFQVDGTPAFLFLNPKAEAICMVYGTIKGEEELARMHRTVQALAGGARATLLTHNGAYASCRGERTEDDSRVSGIGSR